MTWAFIGSLAFVVTILLIAMFSLASIVRSDWNVLGS